MEADKIDPNITKKVSDIMINISDAIDAKDNKKIKEIYEVLDDELDKLEDRFRI
jgi:CRISPR/Cas system CSM-associated protein Csm2 small subunit